MPTRPHSPRKPPAAVLAALALSLAVAGVPQAHAQPQEEAPKPVEPGKEAGLGLTGPTIPEVLRQAQEHPYARPPGDVCETLYDELTALDQALGPDADDPKPVKDAKETGSNAAVSVAKGFIPYRQVVRLITGAGKKENELVEAAMAGASRRGYLRGLQQNCDAEQTARSTDVAAAPASAREPEATTETTALPPADLPPISPATDILAPTTP